MADLTDDDRLALDKVARAAGMEDHALFARVLLHLLDRAAEHVPPPFERPSDAPAPEPPECDGNGWVDWTDTHQTTVTSRADGDKFRCSCGAIGHGWDSAATAAIDAHRHEAEAERDEARARADAAEQEVARLRAGIRSALANHPPAYYRDRFAALLAGPEGTDQ